MSREERAREAEEQAQDVAIGLPVDEELRLAFENRPERLHDLEWDAFAARAVEVEERVRQLFEEMDRNHDGVLSAAGLFLFLFFFFFFFPPFHSRCVFLDCSSWAFVQKLGWR
jgi:hypothetical protein